MGIFQNEIDEKIIYGVIFSSRKEGAIAQAVYLFFIMPVFNACFYYVDLVPLLLFSQSMLMYKYDCCLHKCPVHMNSLECECSNHETLVTYVRTGLCSRYWRPQRLCACDVLCASGTYRYFYIFLFYFCLSNISGILGQPAPMIPNCPFFKVCNKNIPAEPIST